EPDRDRDSLEPPQRAQTETERDAEQEAAGRERDQRLLAPRHEDERERDRERDPADHPRREIGDEMPQLAPDLPAVLRPEHEVDDLAADDGEDPGRRADEREADPRRVDDVLPRGLGVDAAPGQRCRRDDAERERGRTDERGGGDVRVRERRDPPDAEVRGEAEREQVAALQRERNRSSLEQMAEPAAETEPARERRPDDAAAHEGDER